MKMINTAIVLKIETFDIQKSLKIIFLSKHINKLFLYLPWHAPQQQIIIWYCASTEIVNSVRLPELFLRLPIFHFNLYSPVGMQLS